MTETAIIEKARKPKAIQEAPVYVTRSIFRFWDPSGFSPEQWRLIAKEPVNKMAQQFIKRELSALDWEIVSDERGDPRVDQYKDNWDNIFDDGAGFLIWLFRILDDVMTLTFGGASEVGRDGEDLAYVQHVDAATLLPTYDKRQPYVQVNPDNWVDRIYFRKGELERLRYGPRPEIHFKEWQLSPTEEGLLPIEALSKIYLYYMQELTDTPAMGILDVMDMTYEEAMRWSKDFREMMQGTDPLKIPLLYEHKEPAKWIPFNRSPADLNIPDLFKRFSEVLLGKYGLSIGDLRLFEHESTKAGERVSQMVTERSGVGYWAALVAKHLTRLLPPGLIFRFRQPRPEREKIVAERKAVQLSILQAAAGNKQLISVKDAVEEAEALDIFTTPVKPKEEKEQSEIFGPAPGGQQGGQPEQFGADSKEEQDQDADEDLTKSWVGNVHDFVLKALGADWQHPEPPAKDRLQTLIRMGFSKAGRKADAAQISEIEDLIRSNLDLLGDEAVTKTTITEATESKIHQAFTNLFDQLFFLGYIDRDTRIKASGMIGDLLPKMSKDLLSVLQNEDADLNDDDLRILAKGLIEMVQDPADPCEDNPYPFESRGSIATMDRPHSLTAAVKWDRIIDPGLPVSPMIGPAQTIQRPLEGKAQVDNLQIPTLDPGSFPGKTMTYFLHSKSNRNVGEKLEGQGQGSGTDRIPEPDSIPVDQSVHLGQALNLAKTMAASKGRSNGG